MPRSKSESGRGLDRMEELLRLMDEENLQELEVTEGDFHVKLVRQSRHAVLPFHLPMTGVAPVPPKSAPAAGAASVSDDGATVKSPLAGVFYRSSSPQSAPFVKEGDVVSPDRVLCIVEAMKVMNEITAGVAGKIVRILVENGKPVQNGQALFVVDPSA